MLFEYSVRKLFGSSRHVTKKESNREQWVCSFLRVFFFFFCVLSFCSLIFSLLASSWSLCEKLSRALTDVIDPYSGSRDANTVRSLLAASSCVFKSNKPPSPPRPAAVLLSLSLSLVHSCVLYCLVVLWYHLYNFAFRSWLAKALGRARGSLFCFWVFSFSLPPSPFNCSWIKLNTIQSRFASWGSLAVWTPALDKQPIECAVSFRPFGNRSDVATACQLLLLLPCHPLAHTPRSLTNVIASTICWRFPFDDEFSSFSYLFSSRDLKKWTVR